MRMQRSEQDGAEVMMSPMIDAVFLLLIFFLVATMWKKEDKDIDITPPESASASRLMADDKSLVLGIDASEQLYWEGKPSSISEYHHRLRELSLSDPDRQIRLDADEGVTFTRVAEVLNLCQFYRLRNVGIRTYDDRYNRR